MFAGTGVHRICQVQSNWGKLEREAGPRVLRQEIFSDKCAVRRWGRRDEKAGV